MNIFDELHRKLALEWIGHKRMFTFSGNTVKFAFTNIVAPFLSTSFNWKNIQSMTAGYDNIEMVILLILKKLNIGKIPGMMDVIWR